MLKNITGEELQKHLESIIIPESSIGVHGISTSNDGIIIYRKIISNGLEIHHSYAGIVSTVCFINPQENPDTFDIKDITGYCYGIDKNNMLCNVIIAIPEIMELPDGRSIYLGKFLKYNNGYGKNDQRAFSVPINMIEKVPSQFIVGLYIRELNKYEGNFILNNNYIGLQTRENQQEFASKFYRQCNDLLSKKILTFDEIGRESARKITTLRTFANDFYYNSFINKYDTVKNSEVIK